MNKQLQRQMAYAARNAQPDKALCSAEICRRVVEESWYQNARTVMWYVHCRSEVQTLPVIVEQLAEGKRIVVPFCRKNGACEKQLGLWLLSAIEELRPGMWSILEPPRERWSETNKLIHEDELDAVIVPGVGFDREGGRIGNGAGYYDRLLDRVRANTVVTAICYESQLLQSVKMDAHDVYMDFVITEQAIYQGRGRGCR